MLLKWIAQKISSASLDKHRRRTQADIAAYEQEKEACEFRLNEKQAQLRSQLQAEAEQQQASLDKTVATLNHICHGAHALQPGLIQLQQVMLNAIDNWFCYEQASLARQCWGGEIGSCNQAITYYQECLAALDKASESAEYSQWRQLGESAPLTLDSPHLTKASLQVGSWRKEQSMALKRQRERIRSMLSQTRSQKQTIRVELNGALAVLNEAKEALQEKRNTVRAVHRALQEQWQALETAVLADYPSRYEQRERTAELKALRQRVDDRKDKMLARKRELSNDYEYYKERVDRAYRNDDFDSIDADKANRKRAGSQRAEVQEELNELFAERKQLTDEMSRLFEQGKAREALRALLSSSHPSTRVDRVFDLLQALLPEDIARVQGQALGVKTRHISRQLPARQGGRHD